MSTATTATTSSVQWTRRGHDLWTGRRADAPVGTIERGARFTFIDASGHMHRGYRTLVDAQSAAAEPVGSTACGPDAGRRAVPPLLFATATAALVVDAVLVTGAMLLGF